MQRLGIRKIPEEHALSRKVVYRLIHRNSGWMGKGLNFLPVNASLTL